MSRRGEARDMIRAIDEVVQKNGAALPAMEYTPLHALMAIEDGELEGDEAEIRREERLAAFRALLDFFFQGGCEPLNVLRNVFAVAKAVRPGLLGDMSMDDIAVICADGGKATVSARIHRVYNGTLEAAGSTARASCQKGGAYSAAQMGNGNRKAKRRKATRKGGGE
jgi:hypothetical protein